MYYYWMIYKFHILINVVNLCWNKYCEMNLYFIIFVNIINKKKRLMKRFLNTKSLVSKSSLLYYIYYRCTGIWKQWNLVSNFCTSYYISCIYNYDNIVVAHI
jgi:hypothetical protein